MINFTNTITLISTVNNHHYFINIASNDFDHKLNNLNTEIIKQTVSIDNIIELKSIDNIIELKSINKIIELKSINYNIDKNIQLKYINHDYILK